MGGMRSEEKRFVRDPGVVARKIEDEVILVPIRQKATDVDSIYTLNEVAARVWDLLDGERRVADVRDAIVAEFEVSPEQAQADLLELLQQLEGVGAVKEA